MPAPVSDFLSASPVSPVTFGLEPAYNAFNSLSLLNRTDMLSGLDDWVTRTLAALPQERLRQHEVIFVGLYFAIEPTRSFPSFAAYIDDLAQQTPEALRDRVFEAYARLSPCEGAESMSAPTDRPSLLADRAAFLQYLRERFSSEYVFEAIETQAHALLNDPLRLRNQVVEHLQTMWQTVLEPEWTRVTPLLQACVDAYQQIDFSGQSLVQVTESIVGHALTDEWRQKLGTVDRLVCVPSAHLGPYLMKYGQGHAVPRNTPRTLTLLFGARQPQGVTLTSPDLSRSELLVRLVALADDTRLRVLRLIAEQGELCSPDIIRQLDLSQSAASRHLQQLTATGYLEERRRDGAKCYSLSPDRVDDTFRALLRYLQSKRA
ncbi:MAG: winged helix-turn-helix transcriptional regulator [Thermoflexales bacterium]|nr:winged helix-turn-helix transcriptional regulator [Thermoflexales bacterium]